MRKKYILLVLVISLSILVKIYFDRIEQRQFQENQKKNYTSLVNYKKSGTKYIVIDEDITDAPLKTQIEQSILVPDNISESSLRELFNELYAYALSRRGFKFHDSPTNVYIYAFTNKENYESGKWIGMLMKSYDDNIPTISINKIGFPQINTD